MTDPISFGDKLIAVLESNNVYYCPPASVKLKYPCMIYTLANKDVMRANNKQYIKNNVYTVTIIDKDTLSELPGKLESTFEYIVFSRSFTIDNLNHYVYTIYD